MSVACPCAGMDNTTSEILTGRGKGYSREIQRTWSQHLAINQPYERQRGRWNGFLLLPSDLCERKSYRNFRLCPQQSLHPFIRSVTRLFVFRMSTGGFTVMACFHLLYAWRVQTFQARSTPRCVINHGAHRPTISAGQQTRAKHMDGFTNMSGTLTKMTRLLDYNGKRNSGIATFTSSCEEIVHCGDPLI